MYQVYDQWRSKGGALEAPGPGRNLLGGGSLLIENKFFKVV